MRPPTTRRERKLEHLLAAELFISVGAAVHVHQPVHVGDTPRHDHDFLEIAVVCEGHGLHHTADSLEPIEAGDLFVIHPGNWHAYEQCRDLRLYNIDIGLPLLTRELAWTGSDPMLAALHQAAVRHGAIHAINATPGIVGTHLESPILAQLIGYLQQMQRALQSAEPPRARVEAVGWLTVLLGFIAQHMPACGRVRGDKNSASHDADINAMMEAMQADLARDWGLEELAARLHITVPYLVRRFRRTAGSSPMAWLARRRVESAAVLLLTTDLPSADIGRQVGWADASYFARRFRSLFGVPPTAYRAKRPPPSAPPFGSQPESWIQW